MEIPNGTLERLANSESQREENDRYRGICSMVILIPEYGLSLPYPGVGGPHATEYWAFGLSCVVYSHCSRSVLFGS